ncbi:MAG: hypothetical protein OHK0017_04140 [Patescibacteria group bacterium]
MAENKTKLENLESQKISNQILESAQITTDPKTESDSNINSDQSKVYDFMDFKDFRNILILATTLLCLVSLIISAYLIFQLDVLNAKTDQLLQKVNSIVSQQTTNQPLSYSKKTVIESKSNTESNICDKYKSFEIWVGDKGNGDKIFIEGNDTISYEPGDILYCGDQDTSKEPVSKPTTTNGNKPVPVKLASTSFPEISANEFTKWEVGSNYQLSGDLKDVSQLVSQGAKIHLIGSYEAKNGVSLKGRTDVKGNRLGDITINLNANQGKQILFLSSYEPVNWIINNESKAEIPYILVSSYYPSFVKYNSESTKIIDMSSVSGSRGRIYFYKDDSEPRYGVKYDEIQREWVCDDKIDPYLSESNFISALMLMKTITSKDYLPYSAQGSYNPESFTIDNETKGNYLSKAQDGGYCYKDSDGKVKQFRAGN